MSVVVGNKVRFATLRLLVGASIQAEVCFWFIISTRAIIQVSEDDIGEKTTGKGIRNISVHEEDRYEFKPANSWGTHVLQ